MLNEDYHGYYNEFNDNYSFIEGLKNHSNNAKTTPLPQPSTITITTPPTISMTNNTKSPFMNPMSKALEGFDLLGLEDNMKRGKQSSTIPMSQLRNSSDYVMPYEGVM
jgi:hypothetical protein